MNSQFQFFLPTRIEFGVGILSSVGKWVAELSTGKRVLLVTDSDLRKLEIADPVAMSLLQAGFSVDWFDTVEPNPRDVDCEQGGYLARELDIDVIVAVGGGSVIDTAKAIAIIQTHGRRVKDYAGRDKLSRAVTPIVAIPTTAGTGSEVTRSAVITDTETHFKMTVKDVRIAPRLAVVDPTTTYTLPPSLTAATGMDALVHAIEAYTCRLANPMSDALAYAAMKKIVPSLEKAVLHGDDQQARHDMMYGSLLAGLAFSHADVAAVHCLAEALGSKYNTPHGVANSIFLPIVTAYNVPANSKKHADVAEIFGVERHKMTNEHASQLLIEKLVHLSDAIKIPKLSELGYVREKDFSQLAQFAYDNGSTPSNCRTVRVDDYLQLLKEAFSFLGLEKNPINEVAIRMCACID